MQTARTPQATGRRSWKLLGLLPLLILGGCQSRAGTGALVGGGAGALLGNAVAKAAGGSRTAGTAIGGMLGAVGGAVVGDGIDQTERRAEARGRTNALVQQNSMRAPTLQEIADLSRSGINDNVIINQIRTTGATYPTLSSQDILYLKQSAVSDVVIREMQGGAPQRVYSAQPVRFIDPAPVYMAPPQPGISAGIVYQRR